MQAHGPDRVFPPATGLISSRRNLLQHLLRLADVHRVGAPTNGPVHAPAFLQALAHIIKLLAPTESQEVRVADEPVASILRRLESLWIEVVIGESDARAVQEACEYAQDLISRFPATAACYVNECASSFAVPQDALDLLAKATRYIETPEDAFRIDRAQTHVVQVIFRRKLNVAVDDAEAAQDRATRSDRAPARPFLSSGHRAALARITEMGDIFFDRPVLGTSVALRLFPLLVAPTGAGKSFLIRKAAENLRADYLKVTRGDWCPRGAKTGRPTTFVILDHLVKGERVCLHLDEVDKWNLDFTKEWSAGIGSDLWNVLDGHFPIEDYLHETKFGDKTTPSTQEIEQMVRTKLWIVGSGTWQHLFEKGQRAAAMGFAPQPVSAHVTANAIRQGEAISPELLLRFNSDLVFLSYPTQQETPALLRLAGITAMADELGVRVTPDEIDWQQGGMRVLETLATRLTIEKYRRSRKS